MEIQITKLFELIIEGFGDRIFLTSENYRTLDGGWYVKPEKIVMSREVFKHQIDTIDGIYTGIFTDRLNIEKELIKDYMVDDNLEYLSSLIGEPYFTYLEIIEDWNFKKN